MLCAAALLALPFLATASASGQPVAPQREAVPPVASAAAGARLRDVPAFAPGGSAAAAVADGALLRDPRAMRAALDEALAAAFAPAQRAAFERLLANGEPAAAFEEPPYPFRWASVDAVLDRAFPRSPDRRRALAVSDLAGLLILGAVHHVERPALGSAPLAFALLDRARRGGACLPQLNLAFLLSTHLRPRDAATARELHRAARACPGDPTPLWLLAQYRSQRRHTGAGDFEDGIVAWPAVLRPARELQRLLPRSSAGWAAEGDAELRRAFPVEEQPFVARNRYRRALERLRRAQALDPDRALAAGEARALAGLHRYGEAADALRPAVAAAEAPAPLRVALVEHLERAGRFAAAAEAAAALAADSRFPDGAALFPQVANGEAGEPQSLGSGRLLAVRLDVAPIIEPPAADTAVDDLTFIPRYREVWGVTGYEPTCPEWARRRDLVLAGRPREALQGAFPAAGFPDVRPGLEGGRCPESDEPVVPLLAAVAEHEAGNATAAVARLDQIGAPRSRRARLVLLLDARQNLWRFAGRLARARAVAAEWLRLAPASAAAHDRAGEIEFLAGDYAAAARLFGKAARRARERAGTWTAAEAEALVKRGTALAYGGRHTAALEQLATADDVASRAYAVAVRAAQEDEEAEDELAFAAFASYHARVQAGNALLRLRRYADAVEQYEAANEAGRDLAGDGELGRPEVLDNNHALALLRVGEPGAALALLERTLAADPESPIFLQNRGVALRRLGRLGEATAAYRAAVESDPTAFPAWNDLGVVLGRRGRHAEAAGAFRHAVGAAPGYARGWFNLGVALERRGLRHALAAEGAYGRAFRADPELRERERDFVADDHLYFSTLDLSKPLPPRWEYARAQERAPVAAAGLALALLFGLQFGRTALAPGMGRDARRWLELGQNALEGLPAPFTSVAGWVAVAATVLVFLLPLARSPQASLAGALLLALGVLALVTLVLRGRVLVARRAGVTIRQRGWTPGLAVGLLAAAFGLAWAPLPVVESDRPLPALHWVGPVVTGVAALVLLTLGVGLEVPTTRALGTAALVMTASLLTPLEPLDGGVVAKGPAGLAAALAVLAAAVFFLLGLA